MNTLRIVRAGMFLGLFVVVTLLPAAGLAGDSVTEPRPLPIWRNEILVPGVALGAPSMALDPDGYPHLVYGYNGLFHTWLDGAGWHTETLDLRYMMNHFPVVAIDDAGTIVIADRVNDQVFVRTLAPGGSWQVSEVPLLGTSGPQGVALALDSNGRPHVVVGPFINEESYLIYAHATPAGWTAEAVDTERPTGWSMSLTLDSHDRPIILYVRGRYGYKNEELWLARYSGNTWRHELFAPGCSEGLYSIDQSLAIDTQDKVHAVFADGCDSKLKYKREGTTGWETLPVADEGFYASLALDSLGVPHVVYCTIFDWLENTQLYATLTVTGWDIEEVQKGGDTHHNELVLDEAGAAHIASVGDEIQYATNSSGRWHVEAVVREDRIGEINALALNSADIPYVLYSKNQAQELWWGRGMVNDWQNGFVLSLSPLTGTDEVAIAVDSQDRTHIAYFSTASGQLVVGLREEGNWVLQPLAKGYPGLSLAIGKDDRPQLLFHQNSGLTYWTQEGNEWISEPVLGHMGGGYLALDSRDRPHVVYSDDGVWTYAIRKSAGYWVPKSLPFADVSIRALALGPDDIPHLLLTRSEVVEWDRPPIMNVSLWHAERDGQLWHETMLREERDWYPTVRAAVDKNNRVHVIFSYSGYQYQLRDEDKAWSNAIHVLEGGWGNVHLLLGGDEEPRLISQDGASLIFSTREIRWMDNFSFVPAVAR